MEPSEKREKGKEEEEEDQFKEDDILRSHRNNPMSREQFEKLFDSSGRLVNEHELRRAIFKGKYIKRRSELYHVKFLTVLSKRLIVSKFIIEGFG